MNQIIEYWQIKFKDYLFTIGASDGKLAFIGIDEDDIKKWFNASKYQCVQSKLPIDSKYSIMLEEYFLKENLKYDVDEWNHFGTPFQVRVWKELIKLNFGETITYSDLAKKMNAANSVRAIATAIAKNPILIFIPCHRVIGKSNELKYRSGSNVKKKL